LIGLRVSQLTGAEGQSLPNKPFTLKLYLPAFDVARASGVRVE